MSDSQGDTSKKRGGASGLILGGAVALFLTFALLFAIFFFSNRHSVEYNQYLQHVGQLRILSQAMLSSAAQAARGDANAFTTLNANLQEFDSHWNTLQKGDAKSGLFKEMNDVQNTWTKLRTNLTKISNAQLTVISYHQVAEALAESAPQIQNEYEQLGTILEREGAPVSQLRMIDHQALLVERMFRIVNILRTGGVDLEQAVEQFRKQAVELDHNYNVLTRGGNGVPAVTSAEGIKHLREIASLSEFLSGISDEVNGTAPEMVEVSRADKAAYVTAQTLLENLTVLGDGLQKSAQSRVLVIVGYLVGLFALALIAFLYFRTQSELRQEVKETTEENERNQAAIMRLLDEIADLADGDLTVRATVSEAFTGTIADSINTSVEQLRVLVRAINKATSRVAVAINETQKTAQSLAAASQHQAKAITGASKAINDMARSIDQVSADAAKSTEVAERSVTIANNGNQVVKNTITGMTTIREQIQDTSKRIKRLGESSQEIGDIIGLINDISEQTNVLALNAAIQASMAGESGRGFAVVADEVQHLAERSSNASKQIEVLVKTIQSDTNEAIISMEQTTTEVVRGANLAQNAGVALEEIEKVSKSLAALIEGISNAARKQAVDAGNVSEAMKVILDFTSQTSAGTKTTARSIAGLAEMAAELRESASDFTLPEEDEEAVEV